MGAWGSKPEEDAEPTHCDLCGDELEESFVRALGKAYHNECLVCSECEKEVANEEFYPVSDDRLLCGDCYEDEATACESCGTAITQGRSFSTLGRSFHEDCFACSHCNKKLDETQQFFSEEKEVGSRGDSKSEKTVKVVLFCKTCNFKDLENKGAVRCAWCDEWVDETGVFALGKRWHEECFACNHCERPLLEYGEFFEVDGKIYCRNNDCVFMSSQEDKELEIKTKRKIFEVINSPSTGIKRVKART